jgi:DNA-directed RNA polymerase sigma subunit (sigma70/sigma32)
MARRPPPLRFCPDGCGPKSIPGSDPRTLEEIGDEMGLSRERIRQVEAEALWKMRGALGVDGE